MTLASIVVVGLLLQEWSENDYIGGASYQSVHLVC